MTRKGMIRVRQELLGQTLEESFNAMAALLDQTFDERIGAAIEAVLLTRPSDPRGSDPGSPAWLGTEVRARLLCVRDVIKQSETAASTRRSNDVAIAAYELGWAAAMEDVQRWYRALGKTGGRPRADDTAADLEGHLRAGIGAAAAVALMAEQSARPVKSKSVRRRLQRAAARTTRQKK